VPFNEIDAACQKLRTLGEDIAPFEVTLRGYGEFPRVTYMAPADPASILDVFHRIFAEFPDCPPYRGKFGNDLTPHMTVALFKDEQAQQNADLPDYGSLTFTVDRLHMVYGPTKQDKPWLTYDVTPLCKA
jgi:2'-5' RNA ligase